MDFKIDENLPSEAAELLRNAGHDAVSVLDQGLGGCPDREIAAVCKAESRILVTLDTDFADILTYPPHDFAGIVVLRSNDQSTSAVLQLMRRLALAVRSESPRRHLWIVERNRIRVRGPHQAGRRAGG